MTDSTASEQTCPFENASGEPCGSPLHPDYSYCLEHLALLTRINVRERCVAILAEEACVNALELDDSTHFVNDLNFDSLLTVEFIMELEDAFELSIPDENAQGLATLRDAHTYLSRRHLEQGRFVLDADLDPHAVLRSVRERRDTRDRHVHAVVNSTLFMDYAQRLSITPTRLADAVSALLADEWIEHVTTAPSWSGKHLSSVSIILLTESSFLHLGLTSREVLTQRFSINDVFLQPRFVYDANDHLKRIDVAFILPPGQRLGDSNEGAFSFAEKQGISGAMEFLIKYYRFASKDRK